jgi:hypothetical protein
MASSRATLTTPLKINYEDLMGLVEKRAQHSTAKIQKAKLARLCSDKIQPHG